jgi:hypothetical protein
MRPNLYRGAAAVSLGMILYVYPVMAQTAASADARTNAIAASFSKFKSISKEKRGVKKEKYVRVESKPAVLRNPADYSGKYQVTDMDFGLDLNVKSDGTVTGTGYEPLGEGVRRTFTLRNGKIEGAYLTATKVYADGRTEAFEGAFMNRSRYESPTDKGVTVFGFGTIGDAIQIDGNTIDRFFYERLP